MCPNRFSSCLLLASGLLCFAVATAESEKPAVSKPAAQSGPQKKAPTAPAKKDAGTTKSTPPDSKNRVAAAKSADEVAEAAVHASAKSFADAYNRHDAQGIAAGFTPAGELVTEDGTVVRGREAIEQHYRNVFAGAPQSRVGIRIDSIKSLGTGGAIEEGFVESAAGPDELPERSHYIAIHVEQDGQWLVARARDFPAEAAPPPIHERLKDLDFLTGEWLGEEEGAVTHSSCRWVDNGNFMVQDFSIRLAGRVAVVGSMRIGWDSQSQQIRSWTFHSDGGFSEARWTGAGHEWMLKSHGLTHDGRSSSATLLLKRIDATTLSWESRDRIEGGILTPGFGPLIVKRRPPAPAE